MKELPANERRKRVGHKPSDCVVQEIHVLSSDSSFSLSYKSHQSNRLNPSLALSPSDLIVNPFRIFLSLSIFISLVECYSSLYVSSQLRPSLFPTMHITSIRE